MPMRWRWPPENWCGKLSAWSGRRPTRAIRSATCVVPLARRADAVDVERRADDVAHALARIERRERVLEDDLHAPRIARGKRGRERADLLACEARMRPERRRNESHEREARRRLSAAGFADEAQRFAAPRSRS